MRYRIWDTEKKRYVNDFGISFILWPDGKVHRVDWDWETDCETKPGRYVVEFAPGTCDKNGDPIYEGDRVAFRLTTGHNYSGVVVFRDNAFLIGYLDNFDTESTRLLNARYVDDIEIIGNIHDEENH